MTRQTSPHVFRSEVGAVSNGNDLSDSVTSSGYSSPEATIELIYELFALVFNVRYVSVRRCAMQFVNSSFKTDKIMRDEFGIIVFV